MLKKNLLIILLIIVIFILQQSFIMNLNWRFNFWPAILIFILFVFDSKLALFWGLIAGFLADIFSVMPFGTNLFVFLIMLLIIYLLIKDIITNRSLLSLLILVLGGTLIYNLSLWLLSLTVFKLFSLEENIHLNLNTIFVQVVSNLILALVLFYITHRFTNKLKVSLFGS